MSKKITFIKILFYVGAAVDVLATLPLIFPEVAQSGFGLEPFTVTDDYMYVSRMAASLMFGWAFLLFWGSFKPIERKGLLLITLFPVVFGVFISSVLLVNSGYVEVKYLFSLWGYYALLIPAYIYGYIAASKIEKTKNIIS